MKQYRITTADLLYDSPNDCYLSPDDPIQELKALQHLGGLGSQERLQAYRASQQPNNISGTGTEKAELMRKYNIRPGTDEWFKLWFSKPHLTGEKPIKE